MVQVKALPECKNYNGFDFPLTYQPSEEGKKSYPYLQQWIFENKQELIKKTAEHGCILFRGFDLQTPEEFTAVIDSIGLQFMPYIGGAAVRNLVVGDRLFTTNESPPSEPIPFHHEMAQIPNPPTHLAFVCSVPAKTGGATPIIHSHEVYKFLQSTHSEFCSKLEIVGVKYFRVLSQEDDPTSAIGRGWKSTYLLAEERKEGADLATMKQIAENKMASMGITWEWLDNGDLKTLTKALPAIRTDKTTGKKVFFNSIIAAFLGWVDKRNDPLKAVRFGDDSEMDPQILKSIASFMEKERVIIPWQKGDILIVDNSLTMHSREPFSGQRKILASLMQGIDETKSNSTGSFVSHAVLTSGSKMPLVGLGTWKISKQDCEKTILEAIRIGYRHLDCACDYGNEIEVGKGIKLAIEQGLVKREELFITSKLWNTYHAKEHVISACKKTLADLGLDYLDLYLIHFPIALKFVPFEKRYPPEWFFDPNLPAEERKMEFARVPISETWTEMEKLVDQNLVKNIGVANFNTALLADLLNYCRIKPAVNQVELHPFLTQEKLIQFCRINSITVTAFSSFGGSSYVELGMASQNDSVLEAPIVKQIAKKYQKTAAQVALKWAVQRGIVVIPKSSQSNRLKENINLFDFTLQDEDLKSISDLNRNKRFNDPGHFCSVAFNTFCPIYD